MITEDYVSFETAKLLKEKGFDEWCHNYYYADEGLGDEMEYVDFGHLYKNSDELDNVYAAPTLQLAMKWLEEKYGVFCAIRRHGNSDDGFTYSWNCEGKMGLSIGNGGGFKTATEACEAEIKYCLENLI